MPFFYRFFVGLTLFHRKFKQYKKTLTIICGKSTFPWRTSSIIWTIWILFQLKFKSKCSTLCRYTDSKKNCWLFCADLYESSAVFVRLFSFFFCVRLFQSYSSLGFVKINFSITHSFYFLLNSIQHQFIVFAQLLFLPEFVTWNLINIFHKRT